MSSVPARKMSDWTVEEEQRRRVQAAYLTDQVGYVAIRVEAGSARLFDVRGTNVVLVDLPVKQPITGLAFRPRSPQWQGYEAAIAVGESMPSVQRCDLEKPSDEPRKLFMPRAHSVAYSHDGSMVAAGSTDGFLRVWRLIPQPQEILCVRDGFKCVTSVAFDCRKQLLLYTTGCTARFFKMPAIVERKTKGGDEEEQPKPSIRMVPYLTSSDGSDLDWDCYCIATHPTRELVALAGYGEGVYLHDRSGGPVRVLETGVGRYVRELKFVGQNQLLVVGQTGVGLWNLDPQFSRVNLVRSEAPNAGPPLSARQYGDTVYVVRATVVPQPVA